jgi:hypothetical protein
MRVSGHIGPRSPALDGHRGTDHSYPVYLIARLARSGTQMDRGTLMISTVIRPGSRATGTSKSTPSAWRRIFIASTMQPANFIHCRRGHIEISNLDGLGKASCECYAAVRTQYTKLLQPRFLS